MNLSVLDDEKTARTNPDAARQRAENLSILGSKRVLELCCGPSYGTLQSAYQRHGISLVGNDIDWRWMRYARNKGSFVDALCTWRHGDCFNISWGGVDTVVFAPPLTRGCTGRRSDSLHIHDVEPKYSSFLDKWNYRWEEAGRPLGALGNHTWVRPCPRTAVLVLPARSLAVSRDRPALYSLVRHASFIGNVEVFPIYCGRRKILKYVDIYVQKR